MSDFDTVMAITDNLQAVLQKQGIQFLRKEYDEVKNIPASLLPLGQILYTGEAFENTFNEKPSYIEAQFRIKIVIAGRDPFDLMRDEQRWVHLIRGALTVNALNINALAATKYISRVNLPRFETANQKGRSSIVCSPSIRYREI